MPERDYAYDVFVSYTRDHPVGTWVSERFLRDFVGYLNEELGHKARVFYDRDELAPGDNWKQEIQRGLKESKVLVAVCSARYFGDSEYCQTEWYTFGDVSVGDWTVHRPRIPLKYNDGDSFPEEANSTQQIDFSNANLIIEAFYKNDARAIVYEDNVRRLAKAVVKAIGNAPEFSEGFPVNERTEAIRHHLKQPRL
jgi:hypothetical protein